MVENSMVMPTGVNTNRNRQRRVVFYGRVSSEHEAQLSALENQIQWYDDIATRHQNWMVLRRYHGNASKEKTCVSANDSRCKAKEV